MKEDEGHYIFIPCGDSSIVPIWVSDNDDFFSGAGVELDFNDFLDIFNIIGILYLIMFLFFIFMVNGW